MEEEVVGTRNMGESAVYTTINNKIRHEDCWAGELKEWGGWLTEERGGYTWYTHVTSTLISNLAGITLFLVVVCPLFPQRIDPFSSKTLFFFEKITNDFESLMNFFFFLISGVQVKNTNWRFSLDALEGGLYFRCKKNERKRFLFPIYLRSLYECKQSSQLFRD